MSQRDRKLKCLKEEKVRVIINVALCGAVGLGVPLINYFTMTFSLGTSKIIFLISALVGLLQGSELPLINQDIFDATYDLDEDDSDEPEELKIIKDEMQRLEEQERLEELEEDKKYELDNIVNEVKQFDSIDDLDGWRTFIPTTYNDENILLEVETKGQSRTLKRK